MKGRLLKRLTMFLLTAILVLGILPVIPRASADDEEVIQYGLKVNYHMVTSKNMDDIDGKGSASYNPNTKVLTLHKDMYSADVCNYSIDGLIVYAEQDVTLTVYSGYAWMTLLPGTTTTITGPGKITVAGATWGAITINSATLIMDNVDFENTSYISDSSATITGSGIDPKLIIRNSDLSLKGGSNAGVIKGMTGGVELEGCYCYSPSGAEPVDGNLSCTTAHIVRDNTLPDKKYVRTASITVEEPAPGNQVKLKINSKSYGVDIGMNSSREYNNTVAWRDMTDRVVMKGTDYYTEGNTYRISVSVRAASGFYLDENTELYINGRKATQSGFRPSTSDIVPDKATYILDYICATNYGICVGNTEVSNLNKNDILGDGALSYDSANNVLNINGNVNYPIENYGNEGLTINNNGNNFLTNLYGDALVLKAPTTITGEGTLTVTAGRYAIYACSYNAESVIQSTDLVLHGRVGIMLMDDCPVTADYSNITISATEYSIYNYDFKMTSCEIITPGVSYSEYFYTGSYSSGRTPALDVVIERYNDSGIVFCDKMVNEHNCDDIMGDGLYTYDMPSRTLTLNGGEIPGLIRNVSAEDLTIYVASDTEIYEYGFSGIDVYADTTITGPGRLSISGGHSDSPLTIYGGATLTLQDANISTGVIKGKEADGVKPSMEIINSNVSATAINGFTSFEMDNCHIEEPESVFPTDDGIYTIDGTGNEVPYVAADYTKTIVIEPGKAGYGLKVEGTNVTEDNCADILGDGSVSYNPETKTLSIKKAINSQNDDPYNDNPFIFNKSVEGLIIDVGADLTVTGFGTAMALYADTTITGKGKLTLSSEDSPWAYTLRTKDNTLTIKDATVEVTSPSIAFYSSGGRFVADNSDITFETVGDHAGAAIAGLYQDGDEIGFTLTNCELTEPESYMFKYGIMHETDGTTYVHKVVITATGAVKKGDINGDGNVDNKDLILIRRHLASSTQNPFDEKQFAAADTNGDGEINNVDLLKIRKNISDPDKYPL